jgi:death-on-curing protein
LKEPLWIDREQTLAIHARQISEHGGSSGVRDENLLESALARPQNLLAYSEKQPSLARLAAAYAFGIVRNHPFIDGNKRTALVVSFTFLILHGIVITAIREERYFMFYDLAAGHVSEEDLAAWFEKNSAPAVG